MTKGLRRRRKGEMSVRTDNLGKCYHIYRKPLDRLKQSIWRGRKRFFEEFWAVRGISLEVRKGETIGIVGSNGSGKSTLLQLICGILTPTEGHIEVNGRVAALLELGAGFNPEFTGRENVLMNAAIMGLSRQEINERYDDIAAFADIGSFIEQPVKTYSSGMVVRLAFATAINVSPDILVVDEALAVGDARFQQKCMAKIKEFCRAGTVIFVSHDLAAVTELCSRAIWIESGRVKMDRRPKFVAEKYLQYMYEGSAESEPSGSENSPRSSADSQDMSGFLPVDESFRQFGDRKVSIRQVRIRSHGGNGVIWSGQPCEINMILDAHEDISDPIAGYIVKDRLGRDIMGDNNLLIRQKILSFSRGKRYLVTFRLECWPNLQEGDYALCVAVAQGALKNHQQCHFLHDAVIFRSLPSRMPVGIFSVADTNVESKRMKGEG